jgi:hypothetical protein
MLQKCTLSIYIEVYENSIMKSTKNLNEGEGRKDKKDSGVDLVKVHFMQVVNTIMKPFCAINLC